MSYAARTKSERRHIAQGSSLAHTLHEAVAFVAETGEGVEIVDIHAGSVAYDLEADTKADEDAPFFPVLVHTRRTGPVPRSDGERSLRQDAPLVESNHGKTECANGHVVKTVQRGGKGPAFFPTTCPLCLARVDVGRHWACPEAVLGFCPHGVDLDSEFCPEGCHV